MPVNRYFTLFPSQNRYDNEHLLMEDLIQESIQIMGHDCYYILRESLDNIDYIFGEATKVKLNHAYLIDAYIANVEGFEGDGDFFSKFGLEIRDTSNFIIARRTFSHHVPATLRERPREGDLIYVPVMHRIFEIKFIEKKLMFFSLGNRHPYVYEMRCEDFRYSQEQIETKVPSVDEVHKENAYTEKLQLETTGIGSYLEDEVVFQSANGNITYATAKGKVKEWYAANGTMFVYDVMGTFASANLYGQSSGSIYEITTIDDIKSDYVDNDLYDNRRVKDESNVIIDLTETNIFGTI